MKDKIFQKLKQDYSHLGLGDTILREHAAALSAMGLVTDENLDTVVASQKAFLESLQRENDKRVGEATAKAKTSAKKEFEEEQAKKKAEEEERKQEEAKRKGNEELPDWYKKEKEATDNLIKELTKDRKELVDSIKSLKDKSEKLELEKAADERKNLIISKAKELGIPQYRIDEGFNIASDADEAKITEHLTMVSNNIKASQLPGNKTVFPMADGKPDKVEVDAIAKLLAG